MPFCEYVISTIDSITQGKIVELVYMTVLRHKFSFVQFVHFWSQIVTTVNRNLSFLFQRGKSEMTKNLTIIVYIFNVNFIHL